MGLELAPLSLKSLGILDGRVEKLFLQHLARVSQDCMERPRETTKRRVTLEFSFAPVADEETGECEEVRMRFECHSKVPTFRSKSLPLQPTKNGLLFNPEVPENLKQTGLFSEDPREA